ncbi:unnamed protein product [Diamesa serratosioi]
MISNVNKPPQPELAQGGFGSSYSISNKYLNLNSHTITKNITAINDNSTNVKEFSIYRPDIDFSIDYEPVVDKQRLINNNLSDDTKDLKTNINNNNTIHLNQAKQHILIKENGRKLVTSIANYDLNNLHNYSKVPESRMFSNDRNNNKDNNTIVSDKDQVKKNEIMADEDDEIDDNNNPSVKIEAVEEKTPDHHARRPMNAFLIFCKRHRALVREKYPNLENRSITKILGDWWAFLSDEQKTCYTDLAKQYKDSFFLANPNFKWYKLPAPPKKTFMRTRPGNDRTVVMSPNYFHPDYLNDNAVKERGKMSKMNQSSGFGQFKFASMDQMGSLTMLMSQNGSSTIRNNGSAVDESENPDEMNKQNTLQDVLNDAKNAITENLSVYEPQKQSQKRKSDETVEIAQLLANFEENDEDLTRKSRRACKGKRYEEFMSPQKKQHKVKITNVVQSARFPHNGYCKAPESSPIKQQIKINDFSNDFTAPGAGVIESMNNVSGGDVTMGSFDANEFNLDEKINALPGLNLDEYLLRKKESKKKKKFCHKSKIRLNNQNAITSKEKLQGKPMRVVVGSQKRKAPKQTIRRATEVTNDIAPDDKLSLLATIATALQKSKTT